MIEGCGRQLRVAFGGPFALDYGSVMMVGQARGVDAELLADVLPTVERAVLKGLQGDGDDGSQG